jgi:outer membrane protein OmpA-like peptidoglycan-associated protein
MKNTMKNSMKNTMRIQSHSLALPLFVGLAWAACATTTPVELSNARAAYQRASTGPAAQYTPSDLHKAKGALDQAEHNFLEEKSSKKTIDLAYIAERSAQIAEARAATAMAAKSTSSAKQELGTTQEEMTRTAQGALANSREQLAIAERAHAQQAQQAGVDRAARDEADRKAAASEQKAAAADLKTQEANDALAKLAAKEEERGMVITLSGSVLFRSNQASLMPGAESRLDQVAAALVAKGRDVVVEGHTDSKGSQSTNVNLSQRRAESVRSYLVSRGFPVEKIQARGLGSDRPIADNASAEGRANNRRVEIIIPKAP